MSWILVDKNYNLSTFAIFHMISHEECRKLLVVFYIIPCIWFTNLFRGKNYNFTSIQNHFCNYKELADPKMDQSRNFELLPVLETRWWKIVSIIVLDFRYSITPILNISLSNAPAEIFTRAVRWRWSGCTGKTSCRVRSQCKLQPLRKACIFLGKKCVSRPDPVYPHLCR